MAFYEIMEYWINEVPDHLKTQGACIEVVVKCPWLLKYIPDHPKTEEICKEAVRREAYTLRHVPDHFKKEGMCNKAVYDCPWVLGDV